jgi:hypothetical protein
MLAEARVGSFAQVRAALQEIKTISLASCSSLVMGNARFVVALDELAGSHA